MMVVPTIPRNGTPPAKPRPRAQTLFPAGTYTSTERQPFSQVLGPMKTVLGQLAWKNLLNAGNYLYASLGAVYGAIEEIAK